MKIAMPKTNILLNILNNKQEVNVEIFNYRLSYLKKKSLQFHTNAIWILEYLLRKKSEYLFSLFLAHYIYGPSLKTNLAWGLDRHIIYLFLKT